MKHLEFSLRHVTGPSYWVIGELDLSDKLLPDRTQDEHADHRRKAKKGEFTLADASLYLSLFTQLLLNQDHQEYKRGIEEIRQFLQESFDENWLTTLTRIEYNPEKQKDTVIHNYGLPKGKIYTKRADIVGPDGYITELAENEEELPKLKKTLKALDGTDDIELINNVYKWITGRDAYICRLNSKPKETTETVSWFWADSDGAGLGCDGGPSDSSTGLGVRREKN